MTEKSPTRRDLMKPAQLLGLALAAGLFAGFVTLIALGVFQDVPATERIRTIVTALIVAGIAFIAMLVGTALLLLAVDPKTVSQPSKRPVLLPPEEGDGTEGPAAGGKAPRGH